MYPYNFKRGQTIQSDAKGVSALHSFLAHFNIPAASVKAPVTNGVHAAVTSAAVPSVVTTAITNPAVPMNITATAGGVAGDIKAVQVVIEGTNYNDEVITETLPAFTVDTAGTVVGAKAFKTVTKITIPAHDGLGATTAIGFGAIFGLPYKLTAAEQAIVKLFNGSADAGTVAVSSSALCSNTFDPAGVPDGLKAIDLYIVV